MLLSIALIALILSLGDCSQKRQALKEAFYIDKPCERAADRAPLKRLPVRWIAVKINGSDYVATPDGLILLGNLQRNQAR
jgi:hypothetical protein